LKGKSKNLINVLFSHRLVPEGPLKDLGGVIHATIFQEILVKG
jgi:hypothetical protein